MFLIEWVGKSVGKILIYHVIFGQTLKEFESFLHFLLNFFIICYCLYLFIKLKHFENFRKDILMNFLENS